MKDRLMHLAELSRVWEIPLLFFVYYAAVFEIESLQPIGPSGDDGSYSSETWTLTIGLTNKFEVAQKISSGLLKGRAIKYYLNPIKFVEPK